MKKLISIMLCAVMCLSLISCASEKQTGTNPADAQQSETVPQGKDKDKDNKDNDQEKDTDKDKEETASQDFITKDDIEVTQTLSSDTDGEHVITADGTSASYSNTAVEKTGDSSGDEADFYGENAAVFATNGGTLDLTEMVITTDGTHANAVFSYGEGTTVTISDSVIETSGNCSGGLMTTGGGTMTADDLNIHTTGNSSAAIRSDRGGGTVTVTGGSYVTDGKGSPVIYSTADITVNDAYMESTASQGVVVEGKNSVTLNDVELIADNNTKNSDKSSWYQAVMIYQSMSGDAAEGLATFTMNGGSLTNKNGDIFFVNNTVTEITLSQAEIVNEDADGVFLRAAAAGWGSEGSNGGQVTLTALDQEINGNMLVDSVSHLNLYLKDGSVFTGAVNPDGEEGKVYVEIESGSKWILTEDSYITGLTCEAGAVDLNGHTLYINGIAYDGGSSAGEPIEATVSTGGGHGGTPPSGGPGGTPPSGGPGGTPPSGTPGGTRPSGGDGA
ncbi:MAG: hypothetical protein IKX27_05210 [Oscillospiraceae bacterium]|nr:hypothetical protein [Oscillospiraceae bacterium]